MKPVIFDSEANEESDMAQQPDGPEQPKDAALRIPLTEAENRLVTEAATAAQADVVSWLRPIILEAAEELLAQQELLQLTPSNDDLRKLAKTNPPPPAWFEGNEDKPF